MSEDSFLKCEREFFVTSHASKFDVSEKNLNKVLEAYNRYLQKALIDESPFVAEDLKLTILKNRENSANKQ